MSAGPRLFALERDVDVSGVSGVGVVADGVLWPDGTVSVRWRGERPSIVHWTSLDDVKAIHGHNGSTRFEWLDIPTPPAPDYATAWLELRGYVMEAVTGGRTIDPAGMVRYLDELQRKAHAVGRDWLKNVISGMADQSRETP